MPDEVTMAGAKGAAACDEAAAPACGRTQAVEALTPVAEAADGFAADLHKAALDPCAAKADSAAQGLYPTGWASTAAAAGALAAEVIAATSMVSRNALFLMSHPVTRLSSWRIGSALPSVIFNPLQPDPHTRDEACCRRFALPVWEPGASCRTACRTARRSGCAVPIERPR